MVFAGEDLWIHSAGGKLEKAAKLEAKARSLALGGSHLALGDSRGRVLLYRLQPEGCSLEDFFDTSLGSVEVLALEKGRKILAGGPGGLLRLGSGSRLEESLRRRHHSAANTLRQGNSPLAGCAAELIWLRWTDPLYG